DGRVVSIHRRVSAARQRLRDAGISHTESELDARLLAQHVLGWTTERFLTDAQSVEPDGFAPQYDSLVARRATREPLAYIVGVRGVPRDRFARRHRRSVRRDRREPAVRPRSGGGGTAARGPRS